MRKFRFGGLPKAIVLAWTILLFPCLANAQRDDDDDNKTSQTPPGLYITPTALHDAVLQDWNPGLTKYPNFVAGEAVKAVVSPDGKTLAILTAGMNSLIDSTGLAADTAASTGLVSCITSDLYLGVVICSNHETFNRLILDQSIHNLRDICDRDVPVKKVIGFD